MQPDAPTIWERESAKLCMDGLDARQAKTWDDRLDHRRKCRTVMMIYPWLPLRAEKKMHLPCQIGCSVTVGKRECRYMCVCVPDPAWLHLNT